ncbi:hypothetical protein CEXT_701361 [Caerostris extrusa]|uniref:Secreted protein n=1 Tax=Caerostris extrusa TaxID=172846 RepID=A0AAV4VU23_CAEEX|nr:hypothetical protein CEXT_701361 [Caerostris extrusa]
MPRPYPSHLRHIAVTWLVLTVSVQNIEKIQVNGSSLSRINIQETDLFNRSPLFQGCFSYVLLLRGYRRVIHEDPRQMFE